MIKEQEICGSQSCDNLFIISYPGKKYCCLGCSSRERYRVAREKRHQEYYANPKQCGEPSCSKPIPYETRNDNKYCSRTCFGLYNNRQRKEDSWQHPSKIYETQYDSYLAMKARKIGAEGPYSSVSFTECKVTGEMYRHNIPNSHGHIQRSPYVDIDEKKLYYEQAQFKFNVYHFPDEFDIPLLEEKGWYETKGRSRSGKNNSTGVSRDHLYSISEGFKNGVPPEIIAHPANCAIIIHCDNKKKHTDCSITLDELLSRIEEWNEKYID